MPENPASSHDGRAVLTGATTGALAYLLGYGLTYVWKAPAVTDALRGINLLATLFGGSGIPTWKAVGWLFYNAHFVTTRIPTPGSPTFLNLIDASDDGSLALLYVIIPVLILLAGAIVGFLSSDQKASLQSGVLQGALIVVGYGPAALLGAVTIRYPVGNTGANIAPDLIPAIFLAGLVYPLVFGAIGGAISRLA